MKVFNASLLTLLFSCSTDIAIATCTYYKKYTAKWPHCQNIGPCLSGTRSYFESECEKYSQCDGYSFSTMATNGNGCLKDCSAGEGAYGYGATTHDYWERQCTAVVNGDPHFKTWSGEKFDFHGVCDLVLLQSPNFDIHIRTKKTRFWSYVHSVVVRIGDDTLEVTGGVGENNFWLNKARGDASKPITLGQHDVTLNKLSAKSRQFLIDMGTGGHIEIKTWNAMVSVSMEGGDTLFDGSVGLMGSYPAGKKMARDGSTVIEDNNLFGQEWQVKSTESMLFYHVDGPQHPAKCEIPSVAQLRRRLHNSVITKEDAEVACSRVGEEDFDLCVFDVMAVNDKNAAGAY